MTESQIKQIIEPQMERLEICFRDGLADYRTHYSALGHIHSKITQANLLRDHIVDRARNIFSGKANEGVHIRETNNGLFCVEMNGERYDIDGSIWIRFKKLSKQLQTSNIPTQQASKFNSQKPFITKSQLQLPGIEWDMKPKIEPAHLNAGYIINELRTAFEGLFVTYPNGRSSIAWYMSIERQANYNQSTIVELPIATSIEQKIPRRVRAKEMAEKQRMKGNESNT